MFASWSSLNLDRLIAKYYCVGRQSAVCISKIDALMVEYEEDLMSWGMGSWMETTSYVAENPARAAILITLAQAGQTVDEGSLAQMAGMLHQQVAGHPIETALILKHIHDLHEKGLLVRDDSGFRWEMTPLGALVSRQWAPGTAEPPGNDPLDMNQIATWRDRMIQFLDFDSGLADEAGLSREELLAAQSNRLSELRVLNRILGEEKYPEWLADWRESVSRPQ
jgi:hypothetical protein